MWQYATVGNFTPYTQPSSGEFPENITSILSAKNDYVLSVPVKTVDPFLKSKEMFKLLSLCLKPGFTDR
jgi:hypothetical protein